MVIPGSAAGPQVTRLTLTDFRNHSSTDLRFSSTLVAFTGANGAGKTNILEALSLLSPGRGLRRAKLVDLIGTGSSAGFAVSADLIPISFETGDDPIKIGTGLAGPQATGRDIRIDKVPVKSTEDLLELCTVLWLTPAMDGLFTGGASDRRRFFDRMVMALHPRHGRIASRFEQSMRARNKMLDEGVHDPVWFEGVEAQMSEAAAAMQSARLSTLSLLSGAIDKARDAVSAFPHAVLALAGFEGFENEEGYRAQLASGRVRDRAAGRTLEGPHRVDLLVRHGPKDVEARLASTGEQKALLIGLILAQARLVKQETGQAAILLLEEIAAHLDAGRRAALYELCAELGGQTFMTGTDASLFDALDDALGNDADHFTVDDGRVERRG
ncbi:MAG: DNA replication/repair protein RecF [Hyphomicrobiales bacterium]